MAVTSLQNQFISSRFGQLVQISGSALADGDGNYITGSLLNISASYAADALNAQNATAASSAISASHALKADTVISASYAATASLLLGSVVSASYAAFATTASYALNAASAVTTSSLLITASAVDATITFTKGDASTFHVTVTNVVPIKYIESRCSVYTCFGLSFVPLVTIVPIVSSSILTTLNNNDITVF